MALFGQSSGPVPPFDPQILNRKGSLFLTRPTLDDYVATRAELVARANELFDWVERGELNGAHRRGVSARTRRRRAQGARGTEDDRARYCSS